MVFVCDYWGLYQWEHRHIWPRAISARTVSIGSGQRLLLKTLIGTYVTSDGTLVGGLALHVEGDAIGSLGLDLKAG